MKNLFLQLLLITTSLIVFGQTRPHDAYYAEEQGYFINVKPALNGYVFTDNYCNSLYYLNNGELQTLVSAPGCGRYFTVSADGKFVGYKHISDDGQAPAVINLETLKTELLHTPVQLCGQPIFTGSGVAFTIDETLILLEDGITQTTLLGYYSNLIAISPDQNYSVYSNNDRLMMFNVLTGKIIPISAENNLSSYPQFSPDGSKILYQSDQMYVYEISSATTYPIGFGLAPKWTDDSQNIIFHNTLIENNTLKNAEIYICDYKNPVHINLTNTDDEIEMLPISVSNSEIVYTTYSGREIYKLNTSTSEKELIYRHEGNIDIAFFDLKSTKSEVLISGEVPYTHQVYDTPDAHYGYGSCAVATAIMAVAYYNKLPKWPTPVTKLFPHTSYYGSYVSTKYRFNEYYFENSATTSGGDVAYGGYGYMWGLGSPNSQMRNYMELHYFESVQEWNDDVLFADVLAEIDTDYPFPMCVMLTSSGHLILAKGYIVGQHTLIFSDPYGDKNTPSWPSYDGFKAYYDWPGYNNGYENLDYDGSYGVIAWTITAHAEEVTYNDTIIDDVYYHHGFEMNNSENGSQMRYFRDQNAGYNGHSWWTLTEATADDICWVHWIPELTQAGYYNISAYIPVTNANAQNAPYRIKHGDETTTVLIDQADFNDQWADLGNFYYQPGDDFWVYLGDSTGIASESIAYDAVKCDYLPKPVAAFDLAGQDYCVGEEIAFINTSTDAVAFAWNFPGASTSVSVEQNPAINYAAAGIYDLELIAFGIEENDTLELPDYFEIHNAAIADFTVNSNDLYLPNAIAVFENNSQNADSYFWDFGNGSTSSDYNPYCIYSAQGSYTVSLTASNDWCPESLFVLGESIIVSASTQSGISSSDIINVYPNPANNFLEIQFVKEISKISIVNNLGQVVFTSNESEIKRIDISGFANGIYLMEIVSGSEKYLTKIVVER